MLDSYALILDNSKTSKAISSHMLEALGMSFVAVDTEVDAWDQIENDAKPFSLILVSRQALPPDFTAWVTKLRSMPDYNAIPVILLVDGKEQRNKMDSLYDSGFTQVFCRKELDLLSTYIQQIRERNTFSGARNNKAIIVEDDLTQQLRIKSMLEDNQCECFCFTSAEEALSQAQKIDTDIILCDFFLEGVMTALDMILHCRDNEHPWSKVPILVTTAIDDSARKVELVRSGANDYLTKPIDPIDLSLRIENLIRYKHLLDKVEAQHKQMQYLAMHDQLTGLYNRHFVSEQVDLIVAETERYGNDCALLVIDVDHFKQVNDKYGHDIGDKVLVAIADLLKGASRSSDIPARLGGEEFIVILKNTSLDAALAKAEDLREKIEQLCPADIKITASFGVSAFKGENQNFEQVFKAADNAVYIAKRSGRNRVEQATITH